MKVTYILRSDLAVLFEETKPEPFVPNSGDVISLERKVYDVSHRHIPLMRDAVEVFVDEAKPKS